MNVFVPLVSAVSSNVVHGTDAFPQPNTSRATVLEPRASFTLLQSADQLVMVKNFFHSQVVNIGENIRVRDMLPTLLPSDTHECTWYQRVPMMAVENHPGGVVDLSRSSAAVLGLPSVSECCRVPRSVSVSTGPLSRSRTCCL